MKTLLVIQLTRLGDIIQSVPLLDDLREQYPNANIYLLINDVFKEVQCFLGKVKTIPVKLELLVGTQTSEDRLQTSEEPPFVNHPCPSTRGEIRNVLSLEGGLALNETEYSQALLRDLNSLSPDMVVNLNNSPIAKYILERVNCPEKIGFGTEKSQIWSSFVMSFMKTRRLNSINLVDIFRKFGMRNAENEMRWAVETGLAPALKSIVQAKHTSTTARVAPTKSTHPSSNIPSKSIALQCGARNVKRQFHIEHYVDIAEFYLKQGYAVYLLGMESESGVARGIFEKVESKSVGEVYDMTGKTDLQALIDIVSRCERVFTPDTGTMHLAGQCGTAVTALFYGPAYPYETLVYCPPPIPSHLDGVGGAEIFMPDPAAFPCYPCPDDDVCPYQFKCHSFSFLDYLNGRENKGFLKLNVERDEIGQLISPLNPYATLWREFAKHYFFGVKASNNITFTDSQRASITRELKLFQIIELNDTIEVADNFDFLKPLVYFRMLCQEAGFVQAALDFFKAEIVA